MARVCPARQQSLVDNLLPKLAPAHGNRQGRKLFWKLALAGEHLLELAAENRNKIIIGAPNHL